MVFTHILCSIHIYQQYKRSKPYKPRKPKLLFIIGNANLIGTSHYRRIHIEPNIDGGFIDSNRNNTDISLFNSDTRLAIGINIQTTSNDIDLIFFHVQEQLISPSRFYNKNIIYS